MATITLDAKELTDEGKKIWEQISAYETLMSGKSLNPTEKKRRVKLNVYEVELYAIRLEIKRMIKNSMMVVSDCKRIIETYKTKEEYMTSDAKVAMVIHLNLIGRLQKVLDGESAFEHEIKIDDEEEQPNKFYYEPHA